MAFTAIEMNGNANR